MIYKWMRLSLAFMVLYLRTCMLALFALVVRDVINDKVHGFGTFVWLMLTCGAITMMYWLMQEIERALER